LVSGKKGLVKVFDSLEENIQRLKDANIQYTKVQVENLLQHRFKKGILPKKDIYPEAENLEIKHMLHSAMAEVVVLLESNLESDCGHEEEETEEGKKDGEEEGERVERTVEQTTHAPAKMSCMFSQAFITHMLAAMNKKPKALSTYLFHANDSFVKNIKKSWASWKSPEEVDQSVKLLDQALHPQSFQTLDMFVDRMQLLMENISQVYPTIILNKNQQEVKRINFPSSWKPTPEEAKQWSGWMLSKYEVLRPFYGKEGLEPILERMKKQSRGLVALGKKIKYFYQLQQQAIRAPPLASAPAPPVALNADAISLVFKYFIYSIYDHYLMLAEREGLEGSVIDRMMKVFLELFAQDNDLVNQELKPFGDLVIHRQHRAKLHHHRQWSALSKEERQVQRVLRRNKLAPVHRLWKEREEEEEEWSSRDVAGAWEEDEEMEDTDDEE
jgi:hypothetical protein